MFLIAGISQGKNFFNWFSQNILCSRCGKYGRYEVFMLYTYFMFFFIPLLKWDRRYFVRTTCCHTLYMLNPVKGRQIERHRDCMIQPEDLTLCQGQSDRLHRCSRCGYTTAEEFAFCPHCGAPMAS